MKKRLGFVASLLVVCLALLVACGSPSTDTNTGGGGGGGTVDRPPIANAGADNTVLVGATYVLSGFGTDPDGNVITAFQWTALGGAPALSDPTIANPTVTFTANGTYVYGLTVTANGLTSVMDIVEITAYINDRPPVANAGADATVVVNQAKALDGSLSTDPDGDPIIGYTWRVISGSGVFSNPSVVNPTFTPNTVSSHVLGLVVTANGLTSTEDIVVITSVTVLPPTYTVNSFGPNHKVPVGTLATLNCDGDGAVYSINLGVPAGSAVIPTIIANTISFTPDVLGVYNAGCATGDGTTWSASSEATVGAYVTLGAPVTLDVATAKLIVSGTAIATFNSATGQVSVTAVDLSNRWTIQQTRAYLSTTAGEVVEVNLTCTAANNIPLIIQDATSPWTHYGEVSVICDGVNRNYYLTLTSSATDATARTTLLFTEVGNYTVGNITVTPLQ